MQKNGMNVPTPQFLGQSLVATITDLVYLIFQKLILVRSMRIVTGHALALAHRIMYGFLRKLLF